MYVFLSSLIFYINPVSWFYKIVPHLVDTGKDLKILLLGQISGYATNTGMNTYSMAPFVKITVKSNVQY